MKFLSGLVAGVLLANGLPKVLRRVSLDTPETPADWAPRYRTWHEGVEQIEGTA